MNGLIGILRTDALRLVELAQKPIESMDADELTTVIDELAKLIVHTTEFRRELVILCNKRISSEKPEPRPMHIGKTAVPRPPSLDIPIQQLPPPRHEIA